MYLLPLFITMKIKSKMCSKFVQFVSVCISLYQFVQKVQKNYKPCLTLYRYHLLSPELNTSELDTRLNFIILLLLILDIAKYTSNHLFISVISDVKLRGMHHILSTTEQNLNK